MSKVISMLISQAKVIFADTPKLRAIEKGVVEDYATLMVDGTKFPPIVIGSFPSNDEGKKVKEWVIDGGHRLIAMDIVKDKLGVTGIEIERVSYPNEGRAFADMLKRNNERGLMVKAEDRDKRIKELHSNYNLEGKEIASIVGLSASSVSRILAGKQKKREKGTSDTKTPKNITLLSGRSFTSFLEKARISFNSESTRKEIFSYMTELESDQLDDCIEHLAILGSHFTMLQKHLKDLTDAK